MFSVTDISIGFRTATPVLAWLALAFLVVLSIWMYRRTNPPLRLWLRILLAVLRIGAVLLLMLALLEPVINYSREFERNRRVTLLVDQSTSMEREERGTTRAARVDSLLSGSSFAAVRGQVDLTARYFGATLAESPVEVDRSATALGDVLAEADQQQIAEPADYWLLIGDGRSNAGRDPQAVANGLRTPIIAVDVATDVGAFDVRLADIDFDPIQFVGQKSEITARLNWHNAAGREAIVELREGNRTVSQGRLSIGEEGGFGDVTLDYTPAEPGQQLLQVSVVPLDGEETTDNNSRTISVKVLKSRLLVLLVTAAPDYEIGFMKRFFDQSEKYDVDFVVTGAGAGNLSGQIPGRQTELNRYDLVILHDPDPQELQSRRPLFESYLSDKGGGLWVMMGRRFAGRGPVDWFNNLLPFHQSTPRSMQYTQFQGEPAEGQLFHPAVRLADNRAAIRDIWSNMPPFGTLVVCDSIDPNGVLLASVAAGSAWIRSPILGYKRVGPGKVLASAAGPYWPWGFITLGLGESSDSYTAFVGGAAEWLTVTDDFDPVRIGPDMQVFTRGETVRFSGFAGDLGFRPIEGATGSVTLEGAADDARFENDLLELGDGRYRSEFAQLPPGEYRYDAVIEKGGRELKRATGTIRVESFSLEEFDQSGNPQVLRSIAGRTAGGYFTYEDFDKALGSIETRPVIEAVEGEITFFNKLWLLLLFVGLLGVEWLIRKLNHLV
ncbi:hypothetical protein KQH82_08210 [bacterium]|nr:hypothetical protein [bacterium]